MMKTRKRGRRMGAMLTSGMMAIACLLSGCQATPEAQAVVNQNEGAMEAAYIGDSETPNPEATTAPAASYKPDGLWQETIDKSDKFRIVADTEIMVPDVDVYPVQKIAPRDLSQELVDKMVDIFSKDAVLYELDQTTTKSELEVQIMEAEEILALDKAEGRTEDAAEDEARIEELRRKYEEAPEELQRVPGTTEFTYRKDYEGNVLTEEGPIFIDLTADHEDGSVLQISARKQHPTDPSQSPYFVFMDASYATESQDRRNQEGVAQELVYAQNMDEPYRSEELERLDKMEKSIERNMPLYTQNPIDMTQAIAKGNELLEQLGIRGVQIYSAEKALLGPYYAPLGLGDEEEPPLTQHGVYLEFQRENGGIPCVALLAQNGDFSSAAGTKMYSAPFMPEYGSIVFDENFIVRSFDWNNPAEPIEIVAPNSTLIPLEEAKERATEELYRNEMAVSSEYISQYGLAYDIDEMKLVMGYIDAANDTEDALVVPAWFVRAQGRQLEPEEGTGETILYNIQEVMINALDGSPILMPTTLQAYSS